MTEANKTSSDGNLTDLQRKTLEAVMGRTAADPITGRELASFVGLKERDSGKDGADMRSVVNALRTKGWPVCASGAGYWYPRNGAELSAYISELQGRIDSQQKACDGMKEGFAKFGVIAAETGTALAGKSAGFVDLGAPPKKYLVFVASENGKCARTIVYSVRSEHEESFLSRFPDAKLQA